MASFEIHDQDLTSLKDQVIIITGTIPLHEVQMIAKPIKGGASGIGLGTVKLLLDNHAYVVVGDLNTMPISHDRLTFLKTDVTLWTDLSALFKLANSKYGRIDHAFANAGISGRATYLDESLDENGDLLEPNHLVYDINLKGVVNTVALAIHYLRRQTSGGSIVLTASASSFQRFRIVDYTTAKHAVLGLMRGLVPMLLPDIPIRVNSISPSWTATGIVPKDVVEKVAGIATQTPAAVARSVAILMADKQRNGQLIYSVEGKYSEIEGVLLKTAAEIVGDVNEDLVMAKLLEAATFVDSTGTSQNEGGM
ncbi:hypothetical protein H2198_001303 [Neophaeococcomyces mojaviensis]|uniref:Uncharacterized protein n=1 Tax=Neophaeococcomyces mojaviensis TaxID=3383035 RepID=A0ACC3AHI8_9EURO|nr:hypothetical protein H2198_001303 [Knufia sp. JES_112]